MGVVGICRRAARPIITRRCASRCPDAAPGHPPELRPATRAHVPSTARRLVRPTAPADGSGPGGREPRGEPQVEKAAAMPAEPAKPVPPPSPTPRRGRPRRRPTPPPRQPLEQTLQRRSHLPIGESRGATCGTLNGEPILGALFGARRDVVGHRPV